MVARPAAIRSKAAGNVPDQIQYISVALVIHRLVAAAAVVDEASEQLLLDEQSGAQQADAK